MILTQAGYSCAKSLSQLEAMLLPKTTSFFAWRVTNESQRLMVLYEGLVLWAEKHCTAVVVHLSVLLAGPEAASCAG